MAGRMGVTEALELMATSPVPGRDELGVSWGETVWFVSGSVPWWPVPNLTVRQLIGSMANPLLPTSESCSAEIARRLSAACVTLNAPAVCTTAALAGMLRAEPIIAEQQANLGRCTKAIYSLSPCTPDTHVVQFKIATADEVADYGARGAVGIIAGRFIDRKGAPILGPLDERLIGADHQTLRRMAGLLVVSGMHKLEPTLAALRGAMWTISWWTPRLPPRFWQRDPGGVIARQVAGRGDDEPPRKAGRATALSVTDRSGSSVGCPPGPAARRTLA